MKELLSGTGFYAKFNPCKAEWIHTVLIANSPRESVVALLPFILLVLVCLEGPSLLAELL